MKENSKNWLIVILVVIIGILLVVNGVLFYLKNRNLSNIENDTGIKEEIKERR